MGDTGSNDGEILVVGNGSFFPLLRLGSSVGGGGTSPGGGDTDTPKTPPRAWGKLDALNPTEEAAADAKATESKNKIQTEPESINKEFASGMCQLDNGKFVLSEPKMGTETTSQPQWPTEAKYQQQCIAIIHNHTLKATFNPDGSFNAENFERAKRPSEEPGRDRDKMKEIVDAGANGLAFRYYIIGPDGLMRKYPYNSPRGVTGPVVQ